MDDVSKFLQDVKEMNARRTEEDDARQRELDEKIQQEKRERQARRAGTSMSTSTHLAVFLLASPSSHALPCLALLLLVSPPLTRCIIYLPPCLPYSTSFLFPTRPRHKSYFAACRVPFACSCSCRAMFRFRLPLAQELSY